MRASNNYGPRQHPEKLIPLVILNCLHGDPIPIYGNGMQVRNWLFVRDFNSAIDTVLERGEAGAGLQRGGPDEMANIDVVRTILELTGRDESLITYVEDRLGHDTRYSLVCPKTEGLGWKAAVISRKASTGPSPGTATTPSGGEACAPANTANTTCASTAPVCANESPRGHPTELDGPVLVEPTVHADERGFFVETFSGSWREAGIDIDFVQHNHSRSQRGTLRGIHFQAQPGQAKLIRCARGRIFDVAVDMRPSSPTFGEWEATSSTMRTTGSFSFRWDSPMASA